MVKDIILSGIYLKSFIRMLITFVINCKLGNTGTPIQRLHNYTSKYHPNIGYTLVYITRISTYLSNDFTFKMLVYPSRISELCLWITPSPPHPWINPIPLDCPHTPGSHPHTHTYPWITPTPFWITPTHTWITPLHTHTHAWITLSPTHMQHLTMTQFATFQSQLNKSFWKVTTSNDHGTAYCLPTEYHHIQKVQLVLTSTFSQKGVTLHFWSPVFSYLLCSHAEPYWVGRYLIWKLML